MQQTMTFNALASPMQGYPAIPPIRFESPEEVKQLPSNQIAAIQSATTPQEVAAAYSEYSTSMSNAGQTPRPLTDFVK